MNNTDTRYALVNDVTKNHMTIQRISSYRAALELPNVQAQIIVWREEGFKLIEIGERVSIKSTDRFFFK